MDDQQRQEQMLKMMMDRLGRQFERKFGTKSKDFKEFAKSLSQISDEMEEFDDDIDGVRRQFKRLGEEIDKNRDTYIIEQKLKKQYNRLVDSQLQKMGVFGRSITSLNGAMSGFRYGLISMTGLLTGLLVGNIISAATAFRDVDKAGMAAIFGPGGLSEFGKAVADLGVPFNQLIEAVQGSAASIDYYGGTVFKRMVGNAQKSLAQFSVGNAEAAKLVAEYMDSQRKAGVVDLMNSQREEQRSLAQLQGIQEIARLMNISADEAMKRATEIFDNADLQTAMQTLPKELRGAAKANIENIAAILGPELGAKFADVAHREISGYAGESSKFIQDMLRTGNSELANLLLQLSRSVTQEDSAKQILSLERLQSVLRSIDKELAIAGSSFLGVSEGTQNLANLLDITQRMQGERELDPRQRKLNEAREAFVNALNQAKSILSGGFLQGLFETTPELENVTKSLKDFSEGMREAIKNSLPTILKLMKMLPKVLEAVVEFLDKVFTVSPDGDIDFDFGGLVEAMFSKVGAVIMLLFTPGFVWGFAAGAMKTLVVGLVKVLWKGLKALPYKSMFTKAGSFLLRIGTVIKGMIAGLFRGPFRVVLGRLALVGPALIGLFDGIARFIENFGKLSLFDNLIKSFGVFGDSFFDALMYLPALIVDKIFGTDILGFLDETSLIDIASEKLSYLMSDMVDVAKSLFTGAFDMLAEYNPFLESSSEAANRIKKLEEEMGKSNNITNEQMIALRQEKDLYLRKFGEDKFKEHGLRYTTRQPERVSRIATPVSQRPSTIEEQQQPEVAETPQIQAAPALTFETPETMSKDEAIKLLAEMAQHMKTNNDYLSRINHALKMSPYAK